LVGRVAAVAAVVIAVMIVAVVLLQSHTSYEVKADFQNASQLVKGNLVEVAGTPVGTVTKLDLTPDGQAQITLHITSSNFQPVRQGTIATVRQASLSGVANRYVDLRLPPGEQKGIPNGGTILASSTNSAVDLDQLFDASIPPRGGRSAAPSAASRPCTEGAASSSARPTCTSTPSWPPPAACSQSSTPTRRCSRASSWPTPSWSPIWRPARATSPG